MGPSILAVLQAVRLKGRATPESVAAVVGADAESELRQLVTEGLAVEKGEHVRLTPEGRERLGVLVGEERSTIDSEALETLYEEFTSLNHRFKALAVKWQADNDEAILGQVVDDVHPKLGQLLERLIAHARRLAPYPARFDHAVAQLRAGDHAWFLRPVIDSYHTVWFELHEDLIGLAGHTREAEAAAGRAA